MVVALFAALIAPWFINWDNYKANFEAEATRILGQPVHVNGTADASILPSPSLTFTDVTVGETEGAPMMEVKRFSVTIELMPLIQGQISVIAMTLEDPVVRVAVDDAGQVDWTLRGEASRDLNPDNVSLAGVDIRNGTLIYTDAGAKAAVTLSDITATVEARSLAGPWRIEGSYSANGTPSLFQVSTGVRADDGSLRVKTDITPGQWPIAISADGLVTQGDKGPSYTGTYNLTQVIPAIADDGQVEGDTTGWRSEGSFDLTRDKLLVDKAVLSEGPPDRPSSLAGSMALTLGSNASFDATIIARQLDLDRSLGEGPKKPIEMSTAADEFVRWLRGIPVPGIAGTVHFNVPAIVVGGSVIQDVSFTASPADHGWHLRSLNARLPGQATFTADGRLSTGETVSFGGAVQLVVNQPATFAAWWRGKSEGGAGRLLAPFDLSGKATVTLDSLKVEEMETTIGDTKILGLFSWTNNRATGARTLSADLEADRLDFSQVRALGELLGGHNLANSRSLADSYSIRLAANQLKVANVTMKNVWFDAGFANGDLDVKSISVEDVGGAQFTVKSSGIDDVLGAPLGTLAAELNAANPTTLIPVVEQLAAGTPFAAWFRKAAPFLGGSRLNLNLKSQIVEGAPNTEVKVSAKADATDLNISVHLAGTPAAWREGNVEVSADLTSYTAAGVVSQLFLRDAGEAITGDARLDFKAAGVPEQGLATTLGGHVGNLALDFRGNVVVPGDAAPRYDGSFRLDLPDAAPMLNVFDVSLPGIEGVLPVSLAGKATTAGLTADLAWQNGLIAGRQVGGTLRLEQGPKGRLHLGGGDLAVDLVDLGWVAALGLGTTTLSTDLPDEPWSREPFGEAALAGVTADVNIAAERLTVGDGMPVLNADLHLAATPDRVDLDVKSGDALGGTVAGGFSVRNVGGNASLTGNFSLIGGTLDSIIWQRAGRPVGNGTLDLSTNFEATGRSPAGMIASLTGGGTLAIHDGEARYLNPKAGVLVIRDSDLGQEFTEDALRNLLDSYIDNGSLSFNQVEAPFAIAAGTVRFQNITLDAAETRATGSAAIDLNTMTLDSDWTLTLDAGDDRFGGDLPPQVGIVFRGPLATPERILDVLQFNSYLAIRQEARLQEILAMEEQTRLENAFFNRVKRKIREDAEREERIIEAARHARVAYATNLEALHASRESAAERKAEDELIAWWTVAEKAAADKAAAEAEAEQAAADAEAARANAANAAARVAELTDAARAAGDAVASAQNASDAAQTVLASAEADLAAATDTRDAAAARTDAATSAVTEAESALAETESTRGTNATNAQALLVKAEAAADMAATAAETAASARAVADEARRRAAEQASILAGLEADLATANTALDAATAEAIAKSQVADALARASEDAAARAKDNAPDADAAARAAADAEADRVTAQDALAQVETAMASAEANHQTARNGVDDAKARLTADTAAALDAERAAVVARAKANAAAPQESDPAAPTDPALEALLQAADAAETESAAKADIRDRSQAALEAAETDLRDKAAVLTAAQSALTDARARLVDATNAAKTAQDAADQAATTLRAAEMERSVSEKAAGDAQAAAATAAAVVKERTAARDDLLAQVEDARKASDAAAAEAKKAEDAAAAAASDAATAKATAELAARDRDAANASLSDVTGQRDAATEALDAARAEAEAAVAALAEAEARFATATAAHESAAVAADVAKQTLDEALRAADSALTALKEAETEAEAAKATAEAADAAARKAAARAAAMPAGWPVPDRRADVAPTRSNVAVIDLQPAPAVEDVAEPEAEPEPAPALDFIPVTPRLRPARAPVTAADNLDLGLPGSGRQLTISQP